MRMLNPSGFPRPTSDRAGRCPFQRGESRLVRQGNHNPVTFGPAISDRPVDSGPLGQFLSEDDGRHLLGRRQVTAPNDDRRVRQIDRAGSQRRRAWRQCRQGQWNHERDGVESTHFRFGSLLCWSILWRRFVAQAASLPCFETTRILQFATAMTSPNLTNSSCPTVKSLITPGRKIRQWVDPPN